MKIELEALGFVRGGRREMSDDRWARVRARIELDPTRFGEDALLGLDEFSHVDVLFHCDRVDSATAETGARHPRGNRDWPRVGIFAQRGKRRPNGLGVTCCRLLSVEGATIEVEGLDALDGTPVLDIKPHMSGFGPRGEVREPAWAREIMAKYWE